MYKFPAVFDEDLSAEELAYRTRCPIQSSARR